MEKKCPECNQKIVVSNFSETLSKKCESCGNSLEYNKREFSIYKAGSLYGFSATVISFSGIYFLPILKIYLPMANIASSYLIALLVFSPLAIVSVRWRNKLISLQQSSSQEEPFIKKDFLRKLIGIVFLIFLLFFGVVYPFL